MPGRSGRKSFAGWVVKKEILQAGLGQQEKNIASRTGQGSKTFCRPGRAGTGSKNFAQAEPGLDCPFNTPGWKYAKIYYLK